MKVSVSNKRQYHMENALYGISEIAVFVSEIFLFRFLEVRQQQLVRKYRTPALFIKYSIGN